MPHCTKCGATVADNVAFCANCGAPQTTTPGAAQSAPTSNPATGAESGLSENVAGLLCYVLGWITGLVFFLIDKRPFVRFHAAQSIVTFGALHVISLILATAFGMSFWVGGWAGFSMGWALVELVHLVALILWIVCMVKAYQHQMFLVPIAGNIAQGIAGK
jgi:uncharacterized membrane protein